MDLNQLRKNYRPINLQPPQAQALQQGGRGGFLSSLISEGSAAAGAGIGTAIAPGLGTIIGAILGGFGGRLTENKVRDDKFNVGAAAGEGALSGAFAGIAPAFRALKNGVAAAKGAGGLADALQGAKAGFTKAPTSAIAPKLAQKSDQFAVRSFKFTPAQLSKIRTQTGVDASKILKKEGLIGRSSDDIEQLIGTLDEQYGGLLDTIPAVNKGILQRNLQAAYKPLINSKNLNLQKVGQNIKTQADEIIKGYKGKDIPGRELNALKKTFDADTNFNALIANPDLAKLSAKVGSALRKTVNESVGDDALKSLGLRIRNLRRVGEAAAKQTNLGRGNQAIGLTDLLAGGAGSLAGGVPGAIGTVAAKRALNSPTTQRAVAGGLDKLAGLADTPLGRAGTATSSALIPQALGRAPGALTSAGQPQLSSFDASQSTNAASPIQPNNVMGESNITSPTISQPDSLASALSDPAIQQQLLLADLLDPNSQGGNIAALSKIFELTAGQSQNLELGNTAIARISDYESAIENLNQLEGRIGDSGVNQPFIGSLRRLNPYDTEAQDLNSVIRSVRQLVGKALEGGVLRREDEVKYEQMLPKIDDSDDVARAKIANVRQLLESNLGAFMQNQQTYGGGGGLSDALIGAQQAY